MTTSVIIVVCLLLLLAYVFDISSALTKIPAVILLLVLGWGVQQLTQFAGITLPDLNPLLPGLGTIGLILIVLDGTLEIELNRSKVAIIRKSVLMALLPLLVLSFAMALLFQYQAGVSLKLGLANAIPLAIISSSIAIPSVRSLSAANREFVIYESSLSDIFGVLFFNFIVLNTAISAESFGHFGFEILLITAVSFISVLALSFLLSRINHHITYTPIILLVILIYAVSKVYHLPGLLFIMVFGLFLGNLEELKNFSWIEKFRPEKLEKEVAKFKDITIEATFVVRALFFLLFGYLMDAREILNPETFGWAVGIVGLILLLRSITLKVSGMPVFPLLLISPRGLITILLFLSLPVEQGIPLVNKSLVVQVVVLSVVIMMVGLMTTKKPVNDTNGNGVATTPAEGI